ncbi:Os06g0607200, partial [Oryza sativa Japonica Group]
DTACWIIRILKGVLLFFQGIPVFAIGVGQSTYDKASVHYYVQSHIQINEYRDRIVLPMASKKFGRPISTCIKVLDMTGLKLSALNQMKVLHTWTWHIQMFNFCIRSAYHEQLSIICAASD